MRQRLLVERFCYVESFLSADKKKQTASRLRWYEAWRCQHCSGIVEIAKASASTEMGIRFAQHLASCASYCYSVPATAWRCKQRSPKPASSLKQEKLPESWPRLPGAAPPPPPPATVVGSKTKVVKKRRRKLPAAQSRARKEQRERTPIYKWIDQDRPLDW